MHSMEVIDHMIYNNSLGWLLSGPSTLPSLPWKRRYKATKDGRCTQKKSGGVAAVGGGGGNCEQPDQTVEQALFCIGAKRRWRSVNPRGRKQSLNSRETITEWGTRKSPGKRVRIFNRTTNERCKLSGTTTRPSLSLHDESSNEFESTL